MTFTFILNFLLILIFLVSCNSNKNTIKLNINEITLIIGESYKIDLMEYSNYKHTYKSNDENIITVNNQGEVKALNKGETKVIITFKEGKYKDIKKSITFIIKEPLQVNKTKTIEAKDLYDNMDLENSNNLKLTNNKLMLIDNTKSATYESKMIKVSTFNELVLTYNINDYNKGSLVISASVGNEQDFSEFLTIATLLNGKNMSIRDQSNDFAYMNIDTLVNKDLKNNYIKLKIRINPNDNIYIKNISVTTKLKSDEFIYNEDDLMEKIIDVPKINQLSVPTIGNLICSPTSVAMVLNYYGLNVDQIETSNKVYDSTYNIYGNWTFNASYAGSFENIKSRVEYINNFKDVINYIENDIPVVFSITTRSLEDLNGSIMSFPAGHLIVLVGFKLIDDVWYGVFNDPAEYSDNKVLKYYKMEEVLNVWKNYTYIIEAINE